MTTAHPPTAADHDPATAALEVLRHLTVEDIRRRLAEIDAESSQLRVLLRSALYRRRGTPAAPAPRTEGRPHV